MLSTFKPLREKLREATHPSHMAVENKMGLLKPEITQAQYKDILTLFYRFHKTFEEHLRLIPSNHATEFYLKDRTKLEGLIKDLGNQNQDPIGIPQLKNEAELWGALYVIEGSSLGGQMIVKHFSKKFPEMPHHFFAGYGKNTGPMWQGFLKELSLLDESWDQDVIEGAKKTFQSLLSWPL